MDVNEPEPCFLVDLNVDTDDAWYRRTVLNVTEDPLRYECWKVENNLLWKRTSVNGSKGWRQVVPKDMRSQVLKESHDSPLAGHMGVRKTYFRVAEAYYWPKMRSDIAKYVKRCMTCLKSKPVQGEPAGTYGMQRKVNDTWEIVSSDIIGPLPRSSRGNKFLAVSVDNFSKFVVVRPLREATAKAVAQHIEEDIFLTYGVPKTFICDNGKQFVSKIVQDLMKEYGCQCLFNAYYHPQANPAERVNRVIKTLLISFVKEQKEWDRDLNKFICALRTSAHEVTGKTPYFLNYGKEMVLNGNQPNAESDDETQDPVVGRLNRLEKIKREVPDRLRKAYENNAKHYNLRRRNVVYQVGQLVLHRNFQQSKKVDKFSAKLAPKFVGPYRIVKKVGHLIYDLEDDAGKRAGRWHVKDLKEVPQPL